MIRIKSLVCSVYVAFLFFCAGIRYSHRQLSDASPEKTIPAEETTPTTFSGRKFRSLSTFSQVQTAAPKHPPTFPHHYCHVTDHSVLLSLPCPYSTVTSFFICSFSAFNYCHIQCIIFLTAIKNISFLLLYKL